MRLSPSLSILAFPCMPLTSPLLYAPVKVNSRYGYARRLLQKNGSALYVYHTDAFNASEKLICILENILKAISTKR